MFAYHAAFENARLVELGALVPARRRQLERIRVRLVDLRPITRQHYYHPEMRGSWSLKAVMPTIPCGVRYELLNEVQEGGAAQDAYLEAVAQGTTAARRSELRAALLAYCRTDTEALLVLSRFLQGAGRA